MISLERRLMLMENLGAYLSANEPAWREAVSRAGLFNPWFIEPFVDHAVSQICSRFLEPALLRSWASGFTFLNGRERNHTVGLVMAGNIPLVGFHDFLCVFLSGYRMKIKLSQKDEILWNHILSLLLQWEPGLEDRIATGGPLPGCDAYIATGSNGSARYFEYYFSSRPSLIRRNRTSVAWVDGHESRAELEGLARDILLYFGMGCRSVTQVWVPTGYDFLPLLEATAPFGFLADHHRYRNNLDYRLALLVLNRTPYMSRPHLLLVEDSSPFSPIGVLHYHYYEGARPAGLRPEERQDLQCIVGGDGIAWGNSQLPGLSDWADGVNTMDFLGSLQTRL